MEDDRLLPFLEEVMNVKTNRQLARRGYSSKSTANSQKRQKNETVTTTKVCDADEHRGTSFHLVARTQLLLSFLVCQRDDFVLCLTAT